MSWPIQCKNCGSRETQAGIDEIHCLRCGRLTDKHGHLVPLKDQYTSEEL